MTINDKFSWERQKFLCVKHLNRESGFYEFAFKSFSKKGHFWNPGQDRKMSDRLSEILTLF